MAKSRPSQTASALTAIACLVLLALWLRTSWWPQSQASLNLSPQVEIITSDGQIDLIQRPITHLPNGIFDAACYWTLVVLTVTMMVALAVERPFRFSLRAIFYATTLIAIVLGIFLR